MAQWFPEDASCGPVNPMTGLMKQFTQDSSSQHVNLLEINALFFLDISICIVYVLQQ